MRNQASIVYLADEPGTELAEALLAEMRRVEIFASFKTGRSRGRTECFRN